MSKEDLIPAKKGEIRNPRGMAKGTKSTKTILQKLSKAKIKQPDLVFSKGTVKQRSAQEWMHLTMIARAIDKDDKTGVAAYNSIMDRLEGKVIPSKAPPISEDMRVTIRVTPKGEEK